MSFDDADLETVHRVLTDLHARWTPHAGQIEVGKPLINEIVRQLFLECGRNWGKTDFLCYLFWRFANLNPGSENYYFTPLQNQGREIVWQSKRLQGFGNQDWIKSINETEMRITFHNGSFIKVDGSDNVDKYRGVKMTKRGLLALDEYKDFRPEFYGAVDPNLLDAFLVIVGTPPEADSHFTTDADEFEANPDKRYFNHPSERNPHISKEWLEKKKAELYKKGEGVTWEREYMARRVKGGRNSVFPQSASLELVPQKPVLFQLSRDRKKLNFHVIADPGTSTVFAVMFVAVNPYTKKTYVLETIYEDDPALTGVSKIGPRIIETMRRLGQGVGNSSLEWILTCDEAGAWCIREMSDQWDLDFGTSNKSDNEKETGIGLMKDIMDADNMVICEEASKFLWELQNYVKVKGKVPKGRDHLIDTYRYFLGAEGYQLKAENERERSSNPDRRGYTMEQDFPELTEFNDLDYRD